jgi:Icc-related predicted phosphoesterase
LSPRIDENLRPIVLLGGKPDMGHAGSTSVKQTIEKLEPLTCLHGHIHESRGLLKIGRTPCFSPRSEYVTGVLRGLVLNLSDKKLDNYVFSEG